MSENSWDVAQARSLYNIEHWSGGYFDINPAGEMVAIPTPGQPAINLYELASSLPAQGLSLPVLVRFSNILHHRVNSLCQAFATAMQREDYHAQYTAVYPIKVNQQRHVVEEILRAGTASRFRSRQQIRIDRGTGTCPTEWWHRDLQRLQRP